MQKSWFLPLFVPLLLCILVPGVQGEGFNAPSPPIEGRNVADDGPESGAPEAVSTSGGGEPAESALEPLVVTATRIQVPQSQLTKSVSVVTARERDEQQQVFLPELLDNQPGVYLRRLGGPGQYSNLTIRGAGSQHIQYQYNGFPLRDAADSQSTLQYFIEDLYSGSNLKQVEILKGSQSTLYGSQAMGGVVNIIPDKWRRGTGAEVRSEFGEHGYFLGNGRIRHGQETFYVDFNPLFLTTDGAKNGGDHGYYYENLGFTAGAGFRFTPDLSLEFSSIYYDTDLALSKVTPSLDAGGDLVKNLADPDKHREGLLAQYGLTLNHSVTPCWNYSLRGAYTETERHYFWSGVDGNQSNYDGSTAYMETQHNFTVTDWLGLMVGLDYEHSTYDGREPRNPSRGDFSPVKFEEDWYTWDLFSLAGFKWLDDSLFLNVGGRFTDHRKFDSRLVGEVSAAYLYKPSGTKVHGQIGSGYRTPSLYEIYGGYLFRGSLITIGNPDLEPEKSLGTEIGVEQALLGDVLKIGLTWFRTEFDNLIIYDGFANRYANANEAVAQGFETYLKLMPRTWLRLDLAYTYTDSKYRNEDDDEWVRKEYQPRNQVSGLVTVSLPGDVTVSLRTLWQDETIVPLSTPTWTQVRWEEPSVVTFDAAVSWTFLKKYQAYVRVENLLDEDYTESAYVMPGRSVFGGVRLTF